VSERSEHGDVVIRADLAGTLLFTVTAVLAAALFTSLWQWIAAITALVLFAIGVFAFLWSYYNAVQRSRRDEISVTGLYLLVGPPTPAAVRRIMLGLLAVQIAVAVITTFARLEGPDGRAGSSLALGFLVPMLGFGLNGLWAAYHADFPRRSVDRRKPTSVPE
jgi:protein-S-isoprenylcysteine O-methyltransferase Ste14